MESGKVSVIMPCYNDGAYIEESAVSVFRQTYAPVELIVVDDGSNDPRTLQALERLKDQVRCRVLRTDHLGVVPARNKGIAQADGEFILPLDSDDLIDATYIEKAVRIMRADPSVGVVYCLADLFGEEHGPWPLPQYSLKEMLKENIVFVSSVFYKADWERTGGFKSNMTYGLEDYDFWIGLLEIGRQIVQIPEVLFHYRIKKRSRTTVLMENAEHLKAMYVQVYQNHPQFYKKYRDEYAMALRESAVDMLFLKNAMVQKNKLYQVIKRFPHVKAFLKKIIRLQEQAVRKKL